jgi:CBS domain-containing protein
MKAGDVMTRRVITTDPDASVLEAVRLMLQNQISGLPVVDAKDQLVGIVSEGDFIRRSELGTQHKSARWLDFLLGPGRLADEYVRTTGRKISEVMTRDPKAVSADTPLEEVVALMERHHIKRLPVVEDGKLVGIVSRANLLHALASLALDAPARSTDDAAIRQRLLIELEGQRWAPKINVIVRNGIVELWGAIADERERAAFLVAVENIAGVKGVRDHLAFIEPMSGMVFPSPEEEAESRKAS